jgi:hypothetical protein
MVCSKLYVLLSYVRPMAPTCRCPPRIGPNRNNRLRYHVMTPNSDAGKLLTFYFFFFFFFNILHSKLCKTRECLVTVTQQLSFAVAVIPLLGANIACGTPPSIRTSASSWGPTKGPLWRCVIHASSPPSPMDVCKSAAEMPWRPNTSYNNCGNGQVFFFFFGFNPVDDEGGRAS